MKWMAVVGGAVISLVAVYLATGPFLHYTVVLAAGLYLLARGINEIAGSSRTAGTWDRRSIVLVVAGSIASTLLIELVGSLLYPAWSYSFPFYSISLHMVASFGAYLVLLPAAVEILAMAEQAFCVPPADGLPVGSARMEIGAGLSLIAVTLLIGLPYRGAAMVFPPYMAGMTLVLDGLALHISGGSAISHALGSLRGFGAFMMATIGLGLVIEVTNLWQQVWTYSGLPLLEIELFGVPVIVLLGWTTLLIVWDAVYRIGTTV